MTSRPARRPVSREQRERRRAFFLLVAAVLGVAVAFFSGLALVPRVKAVEVFTVIASGIGAGAALTAAIVGLRRGGGGQP